MSQLRKVPSSGFPFGILEDPRNPLTMVHLPTGETVYAKIVDDKRGLLLQFKENPTKYKLILVWQGKASSDVFEIGEADLDKFLDY